MNAGLLRPAVAGLRRLERTRMGTPAAWLTLDEARPTAGDISIAWGASPTGRHRLPKQARRTVGDIPQVHVTSRRNDKGTSHNVCHIEWGQTSPVIPRTQNATARAPAQTSGTEDQPGSHREGRSSTRRSARIGKTSAGRARTTARTSVRLTGDRDARICQAGSSTEADMRSSSSSPFLPHRAVTPARVRTLQEGRSTTRCPHRPACPHGPAAEPQHARFPFAKGRRSPALLWTTAGVGL
jgi:hypothetical protein